MKNLAISFTLIIIFLSCNNQPSIKETNQANTQLVQRFFDHFNNHDWPKMAAMYTETAEFKDPSLGKGIVKQTRAEVVKKYADLNKIFPNLRDDIVSIYPSDNNHIIVEFISRGTGLDNSTFELPICTIFTIENGLITKDFTYFDNF
jgi:ketosteroid isomerase-like protein